MINECIFCQVASGRMASDIVYEDNDVVAFNDINPEAPIHVLVVPRKHVASLNETIPEDGALLGKLITTAVTLAKQRNLDTDGYRIVINTGLQAGQTVEHIHLHLLGGRIFEWPPG
jgi:histidine triad (HIT) family protein